MFELNSLKNFVAAVVAALESNQNLLILFCCSASIWGIASLLYLALAARLITGVSGAW